MPRTRNAPATKARRKKVLKTARGYYGNASRLFRYAKHAVDRAEQFAYRDRRKKKSEFRQLWIIRINAACREEGINYSRLMIGLKKLEIEMNRKSLSELAVNEPDAFKSLIEKVTAA